jgi:hypothetical protein
MDGEWLSDLSHRFLQETPIALDFGFRDAMGRAVAQFGLKSCLEKLPYQLRRGITSQEVTRRDAHLNVIFSHLQLQHGPPVRVD